MHRQLGHYELVEKIGAGGMGEVFRARDTKLGREVALKLLPEAFATDAERLSRFEREARVVASLNHPNIAAIHGFEHVDGQPFLVLELVEGEDLAQVLGRGPLPAAEALPLALQIAAALEAAHEHGIVHRDLKPGNVKLNRTGQVKVLDFGLAKALEGDGRNAALSHSPTLLASGTVAGVILGTAAYMAPEQARGLAVDRRADIFAFGCVLYEMLTGRQVFTGGTVSDILAAVLRAEPELAALPADTLAPVRQLLARCLDKDPRRRLRDIGEARVLLEDVVAGRVSPVAAVPALALVPRQAGRERRAWGAAALVLMALTAVVVWRLRPAPQPTALRKYVLDLGTGEGAPRNPSISPDGKRLAYLYAEKLWVRDLDQLESRAIAVTEETDLIPEWSPDGEFLAFGREDQLYKVNVASGAILPLCKALEFSGGSGLSWTEDGRIVFAVGSEGLFEVRDSGGDARVLLAKDPTIDNDLHQPLVLPDGKGILFAQHRMGFSADRLVLWHEGKRHELMQVPDDASIWDLRYMPSGHIVYKRLGSGAGLWAVPFSLAKLAITGDPFLVSSEGEAPTGTAAGTLVYSRGAMSSQGQLVWVDHEGKILDTASEPVGDIIGMALAPDDRRAALVARDAGNTDIWILDLVRHTRTRFTFDPGSQNEPAWLPDASSIVFSDTRDRNIYIKPADGTAPARRLVGGVQASLGRTGSAFAFRAPTAETEVDIWTAAVDARTDSQVVVRSSAEADQPVLSPRGDYLLYRSNESGRLEIYLTRFPSGQGKWQVSVDGGTWPRWNAQGDRIYFRDDQGFTEVEVELGATVQLGTPRRLFDMGTLGFQYWGTSPYGISADGQRFLLVKRLSATGMSGVIVVENWFSEFAER